MEEDRGSAFSLLLSRFYLLEIIDGSLLLGVISLIYSVNRASSLLLRSL